MVFFDKKYPRLIKSLKVKIAITLISLQFLSNNELLNYSIFFQIFYNIIILYKSINNCHVFTFYIIFGC